MAARHFYLVAPLAYTGAAAAFTYHAESELVLGTVVTIPIGRRQVTGVVQELTSRPAFTTKAAVPLADLPPIPPDLTALAHWLTGYYAASPSSVWSTLLPAGLTKTRRAATAATATGAGQGLPAQPLSSEQTAALNTLRTSPGRTHLVQGVTGSGKTRLYLELAADMLAAGRSVIVLVPEITLTPQVVGQFETAFGQRVLASHSKLTEAQRHHIWNEATAATQAGAARIVIGPRSCLFLPVHHLGLIIIDECHEATYKQEQHPRYHAIPTAAKRAALTGAKLVLGSATPGLGELYLAQAGRIEHVMLTQRANSIPLSQAKILDLREKESFKSSKFITQELVDAIATTTAAGRQTLLYLNRRGSASSQVCGSCGHVTTCPHCHVPLTFHADLMRLICHHCNYRLANPAVCPECNSADFKLLGGGTKRIEAEISRLFPTARLARLDRDSATLSHIQSVYRGLKRGELDIIIGTQMIAKGLDLPAIDTVGIVNADTMLHLPDFTAAERTVQLISQVSGRAGRGDRPGAIYIQTYSPTHPAVLAAASGSFDAFAAAELAERRQLNYPPFVYLLALTVTGASRESAAAEASAFARTLASQPGLAIVGPAPAFIEQQGQRFLWNLTVKSKHRPPLVAIAGSLPGSHWTANLDPINLL